MPEKGPKLTTLPQNLLLLLLPHSRPTIHPSPQSRDRPYRLDSTHYLHRSLERHPLTSAHVCRPLYPPGRPLSDATLRIRRRRCADNTRTLER